LFSHGLKLFMVMTRSDRLMAQFTMSSLSYISFSTTGSSIGEIGHMGCLCESAD